MTDTLRRPVPWTGTPEQREINLATHSWTTLDGQEWVCGDCDAKPWHTSAAYGCMERVPFEEITLTGDPVVDAQLTHPGLFGDPTDEQTSRARHPAGRTS